jgi:hypothetical protein
MWFMKCFVIPLIIGATGSVTKGQRKYLSTISGKAFNRFCTKNSCNWDIAHSKVLQYET